MCHAPTKSVLRVKELSLTVMFGSMDHHVQAAEDGDYSKVQELLQLCKDPFALGAASGAAGKMGGDGSAGSTEASVGVASPDAAVCMLRRMEVFAGKPPGWAKGLCVTCSS